MKKGVTYVDVDELLNRVQSAGFQLINKKNWYQVLGNGGKLYIPIRKQVGRVDVSDFAKGDSVLKLDELEAHGAITHCLNQGVENSDAEPPAKELVLSRFEDLLNQLKATIAPPAKQPKPPKEDGNPALTRTEKDTDRVKKIRESAEKARIARLERAAAVTANLPPIEIPDVPEEAVETAEQTESSNEMLETASIAG